MHKDEIQHQIMKEMNPAFVALSETRLIEDIEDSEVNVPGYNVARCDAENRHTGGVMLYIRNDIKYEVIVKEKIISNCWCIAVKARSNAYKGVIAVVYHSPSASDGDFIRWLEDIVDLLVIKEQCIMIGDVNIDLMTDSFYTKKLKAAMSGLGMKQYVDKPTRITKDSKTLIDIVFANIKVNYKIHNKPKITDHSCISVEFNGSTKENKYREIISRDYSKFHIGEFCKAIEEIYEHRDDLEVSKRAEKFVQSIVSVPDIVAPKKVFRIPERWEGKKWYSEDIEIAVNKRNKMYNKALYSNDEEDWLQYKIERNMSINDIIKSIKGKDSNGRKSIYVIESKGTIDNFELIDVNKVERVIMTLPRKKGTDEGISSDLLKASVHVIRHELASVINDSLSKGICPEGWKTSTIVPIPKIVKPNKACEYRPINILPTYEKILEIVVKEQIEIFLQNNSIITEHQSGFRKNHSCETAIQTVIDEWKLIVSEGKIVGDIFLDLKRAIETVDRERLLEKLYQYGIGGLVLEWIRSYLNNRTQQVKFNNQWPTYIMTNYGVPQGS
ncbi:PREDICTED: uncharacterized protein LOC107193204, partial [Dufourea novaeangliae]|uniref:uncharacterized protein LOC107193204 n=1 Tax=Dufourea novaeangliae TaxID=178035 RepID=UPI00076715B8